MPDVVQEAKTGLGFPPGDCTVCDTDGTDCNTYVSTSRYECEDTKVSFPLVFEGCPRVTRARMSSSSTET